MQFQMRGGRCAEIEGGVAVEVRGEIVADLNFQTRKRDLPQRGAERAVCLPWQIERAGAGQMQSTIGAREREFDGMLIEDKSAVEIGARVAGVFVEGRFHRQARALACAGRKAEGIRRAGHVEMSVATERAGERIGLGR